MLRSILPFYVAWKGLDNRANELLIDSESWQRNLKADRSCSQSTELG
jgi:hypothetical protein